MKNETTIRISKELNKKLNILCATVDTKKTRLIALWSKIPEKVVEDLVKKYDK